MEQKIKTLTDREKCRLRLPVFFGSFDSRDMAFIETLMNARDELENHCDWEGYINISLSEDNKTVTVEDNGRGIPLSAKDKNGERNYIKLFETLFAGCNFENNISDELIESAGQNGVGASCTAYNSIFYQATEYKNFIAREVTYTDGCLTRDYREYKSDKEHGTKIIFTLDDRTFTNVIFNPEYLRQYIKKISSTTNDIHYSFTYNGITEEFYFENIEDYFNDIVENKLSNMIHFNNKIFNIDSKKDGQSFVEKDRIELLLSLSTDPVQQTFLNGGFLEENGTFYTGIIDGLRKYFQKNTQDKKCKLTSQDIEMSFNIYGIMGSNNPVYSNQTKKAASNELYKKLASDYIVENMEIYKAENPQDFDKIVKHLEQINSFNSKNENAIKNIKKKLSEKSEGIGNKVASLVDCREHGENAELFICEGLSALSSVVAARNATFQAVMPVRGKTLSVLKASLEQIFSNQIIIDMIKALGCGIEIQSKKNKELYTFDINKLKYDKIVITCDADADGAQICCLLLTTIYVLMPTLLKKGHMYIAKSPLYEINTKENGMIYAFNDLEKDKIVSEYQIIQIKRAKGLGELDADTLSETTMNPKTRFIEQVIVENDEDMKYYFEKWMGVDVTLRKEHITEALYKYMENLD